MSTKKKGLIQLMGVIAFIALSFMVSNLLQTKKQTLQSNEGDDRLLHVETARVVPQGHRISFNATGNVIAQVEIGVVPQVSGRVTSVNNNFYEGGAFNKGELLFQIDPIDYELQIEQLEADIARARTLVAQELAEANIARDEWQSINGSKPISALAARQPQLDEARANLQAAKAQLKVAQLNLKRTSFSLPFSGRVLDSDIAIGRHISAGQSYGTVFSNEGLEIQTYLKDSQLQWLRSAEDADITITTTYLGEEKTYKGFLKRGAASLNRETRFAQVRFGFAEESPQTLPGVFADLNIEGSELEGITLLPPTSLQKQGNIWLVSQENTLRSFTPEILYSTDKYIAVRNITNQITVVKGPLSGAADGMKVMPQKGNENE